MARVLSFYARAVLDHANVGRILARKWTTLAAAIVIALAANAGAADDAAPIVRREVLAESVGDPVQRLCVQPNCAIVLAIRHADTYESGPVVQVRGPLMSNPPLGVYNPHVAPIMQSAFPVQRRKDVWIIEVRRRDGTVQAIQRSFPALFQVGEEVLVEGDRIRVPD